jgi:hypothetical protein
MTSISLRRWALTGFVALSGTATGVGGLAGVAPAKAGHSHRAKHPAKHHKSHRSQGGGIPQHNGGDHDADNNGGPSDGDGNV